MQILEPPSTTTYSNQEGHFIKTFLISTKLNENGWKISKETGHKLVKTFEGKPFVIIPEALSDSRQAGHIHADSKDELLQEYKKHTHGIIESVSSPYYYGDGSDDYFYMANIKLSDSKAAAALLKNGYDTWSAFAVSPHIWGNEDDWEGISLSLVPAGAYGKDAVVSKYCKGSKDSCDASMAATVCDKEDSKAASMITSLLEQNQNNPILTAQVVEVKEGSLTPKQEEVKQDNSKEELEQLKKQLEQAQLQNKEKEDIVTKLVNKDKTNTLNKIFNVVSDETVKESLIQKYITADTDLLNGYTEDFVKHVVPSLIEQAKVQAEKELKEKVTAENKSKAGSLPKEPESVKETEIIVPNKENEVLKLSKLIRGGF